MLAAVPLADNMMPQSPPPSQDRPAATERERRLEALLVEALPFVSEAKKHVWTVAGVTKALRLIDAIREEVGR